MKKALAVAGRELADRRMVVITAAVLAILPFAALLIPEIGRHGTGRVIATTAAATAAIYGFALAFVLGGSFVVRELTDKRMSFYFSKPLAGTTIWFGKLAGTLATIVLSLAIILIPSVAATGDRLLAKPEAVIWIAGAILFFFLLAHTSATMVRSRSPLLILDVTGVVLAGTAMYRIMHALHAGHAEMLQAVFLGSFGVLLPVILIAAGAWQVSRGRIDGRRNHRELSRFLWTAVAAMLVVAGAAVVWIVSVDPADLRGAQTRVDQPANGSWVRLSGRAKNRADYHAVFFVNVANGAHVRGDGWTIWSDGFFTPDGRVGGQLRRPEEKRNLELELLRFGERDVQVVPTKVEVEPAATLMSNDDATRLAVLAGDSIRVQSLPNGDVLAAARLPVRPQHARYFFINPELVRIYAQVLEGTQIYELDVRAKKLTQTGAIPGRVFFNANADASRLFVRNIAGDAFLADARTGAQLETLGPAHGAILQDGRVATVAGNTLSIGPLRVALPDVDRVRVFRELSGNRLLAGGTVKEEWTLHVVDTTSGKIVRSERGVVPLQYDFFNYAGRDPRHTVAAADTPLVVQRGDAIVRWTPATGATAGL